MHVCPPLRAGVFCWVKACAAAAPQRFPGLQVQHIHALLPAALQKRSALRRQLLPLRLRGQWAVGGTLAVQPHKHLPLLQGDRNGAAPDADALPFQPELPGVALPGKQPVDLGLLQGQGRIARYGVQNTALLYRYLFRVPPENGQKPRLCMLIQPGCGGCCGLYLCHQSIRQGGPCGKVACLSFCAKQPCRRASAAAPQHQLLVLC